MSDVLTIIAAMATIAGGTAVLASAETVSDNSALPRFAQLSEPVTANRSSLIVETRPLPGRGSVFHTVGSINATNIDFLIDTGSNITVLTERDARKAGITESGRTALTGIGGTIFVGSATVNLSIYDQRLTNVSVVIAPDAKISLLGLNVLHKIGEPRLSIH